MDTHKYPREVEWELVQNIRKDYIQLAELVNENPDITGVILQHEYGIFGDCYGKKLLSFMKACKKPVVVTLHTVLPNPLPQMKLVTGEIIRYAATVVVLTHNSKKIIENLYPKSKGKVHVVPHGIPQTSFSTQQEYKEKIELPDRTILSTFGLLSVGKGIEYVIHSLPEVIQQHPTLVYLILGETHPVVRRREGEKYRRKLLQLVTQLKLEKHIKFYDQYLSLDDLFEFLKATDIYISTSTNPHQAVSGTLSYALGTGRPVVSTEFAQAKEIITLDVGRLVAIKDSKALTEALLDLLSDTERLQRMSQAAYSATRPMVWSKVAESYITLLNRTVIPELKLDHLKAMTDDFGFFQFSLYTKPDRKSGYTLDDNARALILCSWLIRKNYSKELEDLIAIYLAFIKKCQLANGAFINYIGPDKIATAQNKIENLEDAQSRALWALSEVIKNKTLPLQMRNEAKKMFLLTLEKGPEPTFLRSQAFTLKAYSLVIKDFKEHRSRLVKKIDGLATSLEKALLENSDSLWNWFENTLSYNNALLPESLFIAGDVTGNTAFTKAAVRSITFLIQQTFTGNMYHPIGHSAWYEKNGTRSTHDQQPEDPASMIIALAQACKSTHNETYKILALQCFSWFLGNNTLGVIMHDPVTGGCYDGLEVDKVNENQGAESLISYLMANYLTTRLFNEN